MEIKLETGRTSPIQPKLQERSPHNWVGWGWGGRGGIRTGPLPLGGIYKGEKVHTGRPLPCGAPCLLGNPPGQIEGLEGLDSAREN